MTKNKTLVTLGILASVEAVVAMLWKNNDRTRKVQAVRVLRIAGGLVMIFIGYGYCVYGQEKDKVG